MNSSIKSKICFFVFQCAAFAGPALSFTNYRFKKNVSFIGLCNFLRLFKSALWGKAFRNTLIINAYSIIFCFPFSMIFSGVGLVCALDWTAMLLEEFPLQAYLWKKGGLEG